MDSKEIRGLMEAYAEVYAPQEEIEEATYSATAARAGKDIGKPGKAFAKIAKSAAERYGSKERGEKVAGAVLAKLRKQHEEVEIDEAVKGASPHTMQMRKDAAAERRAGIKPLPAKEGEKYAKYKMAQMAYSKRKREMDEELDIFDVVLEFLQAEGYAETLEQAEWMMANVIDEEAIDIILSEGIPLRGTTPDGKPWRVDPDQLKMKMKKNPKEKEPYNEKLRSSSSKKERYEEVGYVDEAQVANRDPDKYEREQAKKSAPVRGERTPMPPRGDKRREDFEKWYAKQMGR